MLCRIFFCLWAAKLCVRTYGTMVIAASVVPGSQPVAYRVQALGVSSVVTVAALLPKDLRRPVADPGETPIGSSWWHMGRWCVYSLHYPFVRLVQ